MMMNELSVLSTTPSNTSSPNNNNNSTLLTPRPPSSPCPTSSSSHDNGRNRRRQSTSSPSVIPTTTNHHTGKVRLNIDLKDINNNNDIFPRNNNTYNNTGATIMKNDVNNSLKDNSTSTTTVITITPSSSSSYRNNVVDKDDLMKIVPYSPLIPSPIMSKGLFGGDGCNFSPRSHWLSKQKKVLSKEKNNQSLLSIGGGGSGGSGGGGEEENELSLMSPRHVVDIYSTTKKKFSEIKNNPIFDTALLENKSKVAEFKSEKFKILREFCDMNSTLDVCYKELGSFTSPEKSMDPLKVAVDKAAFEQSPIHEHEDVLHKKRQLKRMMENPNNQNLANDYANDMELKTLLLICDLREKEKKDILTPPKKSLTSPRTPRTPHTPSSGGRNKLPPLKFSEQFKLTKLQSSNQHDSILDSPLKNNHSNVVLR